MAWFRWSALELWYQSILHTLIFVLGVIAEMYGFECISSEQFKVLWDFENQREFECGICLMITGGLLAALVATIHILNTGNRARLKNMELFLLLLLIVTHVVGVLLVINGVPAMEDNVRRSLTDGLDYYANDFQVRKIVDSIQTKLQCCGVDSGLDFPGGIPTSCVDVQHFDTFSQGCFDALMGFVNENSKYSSELMITSFIFEVVGLLTCIWSKCKEQKIGENHVNRAKVWKTNEDDEFLEITLLQNS